MFIEIINKILNAFSGANHLVSKDFKTKEFEQDLVTSKKFAYSISFLGHLTTRHQKANNSVIIFNKFQECAYPSHEGKTLSEVKDR